MRKLLRTLWELQLKIIEDGSTKQEAVNKMEELNAEIIGADKTCMVEFTLGSNEPLFNCINASVLDFMTDENKTFLINKLS